jgi:hypothetical protein
MSHGVRTREELAAEGWVRRSLADEQRAREAVEIYTAAGFEVLLVKVEEQDFQSACQGCASTLCGGAWAIVYTRRKEKP